MVRVEHSLAAFPRDGDELLGQWPLRGLSVDELREMFGCPDDDPMYLEYPVQSRHVERLELASGETLDLTRCEYFVSPVRLD